MIAKTWLIDFHSRKMKQSVIPFEFHWLGSAWRLTTKQMVRTSEVNDAQEPNKWLNLNNIALYLLTHFSLRFSLLLSATCSVISAMLSLQHATRTQTINAYVCVQMSLSFAFCFSSCSAVSLLFVFTICSALHEGRRQKMPPAPDSATRKIVFFQFFFCIHACCAKRVRAQKSYAPCKYNSSVALCSHVPSSQTQLLFFHEKRENGRIIHSSRFLRLLPSHFAWIKCVSCQLNSGSFSCASSISIFHSVSNSFILRFGCWCWASEPRQEVRNDSSSAPERSVCQERTRVQRHVVGLSRSSMLNRKRNWTLSLFPMLTLCFGRGGYVCVWAMAYRGTWLIGISKHRHETDGWPEVLYSYFVDRFALPKIINNDPISNWLAWKQCVLGGLQFHNHFVCVWRVRK